MKLLGYLVMTVCIFICTGCPGSGCLDALYSFSATSQLIPDYDSIQVGDTIILTSTIPVDLRDQISGTTINYSNSKTIGSDLSIGRLETNDSFPIDAVAEFDYFSVIGSIYNDRNIASPNGVQQLSYEETSGNYELKIGIIAKRKGIYVFGIGNGLSNGRNNSHSCEKAAFNLSLKNTSQHVHYYEEWRPDYVLTADDLQRIYCFKVY